MPIHLICKFLKVFKMKMPKHRKGFKQDLLKVGLPVEDGPHRLDVLDGGRLVARQREVVAVYIWEAGRRV